MVSEGTQVVAVAGGQLILGEVAVEAVEGELRAVDASLGDEAVLLVVDVELQASHVVLEHVSTLDVVVVDEVDIEAGGTVAQVLGHHVAGGERQCGKDGHQPSLQFQSFHICILFLFSFSLLRWQQRHNAGEAVAAGAHTGNRDILF